MRVRLHADDLGVSRGVTDGILRCIDEGPVSGTSIIANGAAFQYAVDALRSRRRVEVSVHLNLIEGAPVAPAGDLDLLADSRGLLRHSFPSLWKAHTLGNAATRARLEAQVRTEFYAQAEKARDALGRDVPLRLDSHQHVHHIPFVFRIVADLCRDLPAVGLRMVREPLFVSLRGLRRHTLGGLARHALLNALAARHRAELAARQIACDDWVVGILLTGRMSAAAVEAALGRIWARVGPASAEQSVEVLFHPGGAAPGEEAIWASYPSLRAYYYSPWRRAESESLRGPEMAACLERWRPVSEPAARPPGSTTGS
jgi:chitin disaccharide deacetylase